MFITLYKVNRLLVSRHNRLPQGSLGSNKIFQGSSTDNRYDAACMRCIRRQLLNQEKHLLKHAADHTSGHCHSPGHCSELGPITMHPSTVLNKHTSLRLSPPASTRSTHLFKTFLQFEGHKNINVCVVCYRCFILSHCS